MEARQRSPGRENVVTSGQKLVLLSGNKVNKGRAVRAPVGWEGRRGAGNKMVQWVGTVTRSDPQGPARGFRTCPDDNRETFEGSGNRVRTSGVPCPGHQGRRWGVRAGGGHRHISGEKSRGPDLERVTMVEKREEIRAMRVR